MTFWNCFRWKLLVESGPNVFLAGCSINIPEYTNSVAWISVYTELPPGISLKDQISKVCCPKKALYRLKQSPRAWFSRFSQAMLIHKMSSRSHCS